MNGGITSSSQVTTQTPWCGLGVWFSSIMIYLEGTEQPNGYPVSSPSDPGRNLSHLRKNKTCSVGVDAWVFLKIFQVRSFLLSFMACDKNWIFLILYKKNRMFSWTSYLIRNSDTSHFLCYRPDCLADIIVNHGLDLTHKFGSSFLKRTIRVSFSVSRTFSVTHPILFESSALSSTDWHSNIMKSSYWDFWMLSRTACCFQIS